MYDGMTDPAKTVCTQQLYFFTFDRLGEYQSDVAPQGTPHYYKLNDTQQQSELPSESCRQYVPTPPPAQHGMRKRCLDPSSRSHQPVATCLVGGGSRGGGGMALYKWSFGHQQKLSGLFWVKYRQQNKCVCVRLFIFIIRF